MVGVCVVPQTVLEETRANSLPAYRLVDEMSGMGGDACKGWGWFLDFGKRVEGGTGKNRRARPSTING